MTPTELTIRRLKKDGYTVQVAEHWNSFGGVRVDLFGGIDIVAIKKGITGVLGVQTTSRNNFTARVKKVLESNKLKLWVECGNRIFVHGWEKKTNGKRSVYVVKEVEILIEHYNA